MLEQGRVNPNNEIDLIEKGLKIMHDELEAIRCLDKKTLSEAQIDNIIRFFGGHVIDQFSLEEEQMLRYNYTGYDMHKEEHMRFLKNFATLKKLFREERSPSLMIMVIEHEYIHWLAKHTREFDKTMLSSLKAAR